MMSFIIFILRISDIRFLWFCLSERILALIFCWAGLSFCMTGSGLSTSTGSSFESSSRKSVSKMMAVRMLSGMLTSLSELVTNSLRILTAAHTSGLDLDLDTDFLLSTAALAFARAVFTWFSTPGFTCMEIGKGVTELSVKCFWGLGSSSNVRDGCFKDDCCGDPISFSIDINLLSLSFFCAKRDWNNFECWPWLFFLSWFVIDFCSLLEAGNNPGPMAPGVAWVTTWGWGLVTSRGSGEVTEGLCLTCDISLISEGSGTRGEKDGDCGWIIWGRLPGKGVVTEGCGWGGTGTCWGWALCIIWGLILRWVWGLGEADWGRGPGWNLGWIVGWGWVGWGWWGWSIKYKHISSMIMF